MKNLRLKWDDDARYRKNDLEALLVSSFEVFVERLVDDDGRDLVIEEDVKEGLRRFVGGSAAASMEIDEFLEWSDEDCIGQTIEEWDGRMAYDFAGIRRVIDVEKEEDTDA